MTSKFNFIKNSLMGSSTMPGSAFSGMAGWSVGNHHHHGHHHHHADGSCCGHDHSHDHDHGDCGHDHVHDESCGHGKAGK